MVQQQSTQAGELFSAARSSRAAVEATGHHVPVAGVLTADRLIHHHDSAVQVSDAKHHALNDGRITGKDGGNQRAQPAADDRDQVYVCDPAKGRVLIVKDAAAANGS